MPGAYVDVEGLVAALDGQRIARNLSWRQVAGQAGVSASTLTRMQQGKSPDVRTFTSLLNWLKMPAEDFTLEGNRPGKNEVAHPLAVASTLLRGKKKMTPEAMKALEQLVQAAFNFSEKLK